jgi:hypothetical protein
MIQKMILLSITAQGHREISNLKKSRRPHLTIMEMDPRAVELPCDPVATAPPIDWSM